MKKIRSIKEQRLNRRSFVKKGGIFLSAFAAGNIVLPGKTSVQDEKEEISPVEDLMREHGILQRVLLVYEEGVNRINNNNEVNPSVFNQAANIIHEFVESYHEVQEEEFLFPRFRKANEQLELVNILENQHLAGRNVTEHILHLTKDPKQWDQKAQQQLSEFMASYIRMYRPHEAREDTVLFPAFKKLVSKNEYDSLGEQFEKKEHEVFGEGGFQEFVSKVAELEKELEIYDISQYTPDVR